jgi:hypothetical protein
MIAAQSTQASQTASKHRSKCNSVVETDKKRPIAALVASDVISRSSSPVRVQDMPYAKLCQSLRESWASRCRKQPESKLLIGKEVTALKEPLMSSLRLAECEEFLDILQAIMAEVMSTASWALQGR